MIRRATTEDIERLCELEMLLFPENSLSIAQFERELAIGEVYVLGEPVHAYALVGWSGEILDLLRLGVHPEVQGRGVGGTLLRFVLSLNDTVILTVKKNNHHALRLYKKHGFEVVGHFSEAEAWELCRAAAYTACPSAP